MDFNSKLVRLKVAFRRATLKPLLNFQFQTGAIKSTPKRDAKIQSVLVFQFQTGAIKSYSVASICKNLLKFQFQTGAIKSQSPSINPRKIVADFNSKLVRLKGKGEPIYEALQAYFNSKLVRLKGCK